MNDRLVRYSESSIFRKRIYPTSVPRSCSSALAVAAAAAAAGFKPERNPNSQTRMPSKTIVVCRLGNDCHCRLGNDCRSRLGNDCRSRLGNDCRCRLGNDCVSMTSPRRHLDDRQQSACCSLGALSSWSLRVYWFCLVVWCLLCVSVAPLEVGVPRSRSRFTFHRRSESPQTPTPRIPEHQHHVHHHHHQHHHASVLPPSGDNGISTQSSRQPLFEAVTSMTTAMTLKMASMPSRRQNIRKILEGSDGETRNRGTRRPQSRSYNADHHQPGTIVTRITLEPVSVDVFRRKLQTARSYRDVVRIFVRSEKRLRDEDIDDFISSPLIAGASLTAAAAAAAGVVGGVIRSNGFPRDRGSVGSSGRQSIDENFIPSNEWEMAMNHFNEMQGKGDCRHPLPKFIRVRHHELARPESDYVPECTVVYRCHKDYGCCNSTSECGVKTSNYIYRSFWELTCPPGTNCTEYNIPVVKSLRFVNHTECECKPVKQLPRCHVCPVPFEIVGGEDFSRCNCTCDEQNQLCLNISNGISPLDAEQASCVLQSNCEKPFCTNGEYNMSTGFCPCPEDSFDCRSTTSTATTQDYEDDDDEDDDDDDDDEDDEEEDFTAEDQETTLEEQTTRATDFTGTSTDLPT